MCGLVLFTVSPPLGSFPFLKAPTLLFIKLYFEIVTNICPVAESGQHKILNELIDLSFLPKSGNIPKHRILCHFVE